VEGMPRSILTSQFLAAFGLWSAGRLPTREARHAGTVSCGFTGSLRCISLALCVYASHCSLDEEPSQRWYLSSIGAVSSFTLFF
jgi:hypothetical protein